MPLHLKMTCHWCVAWASDTCTPLTASVHHGIKCTHERAAAQEGVQFEPVKIVKLQGVAMGRTPAPETWRYLVAWKRLPVGTELVCALGLTCIQLAAQ